MAEFLRHRTALGARLGLMPMAPVLLFVTAILAGSMLTPHADAERMRAWLAGLAVYAVCRRTPRSYVIGALRIAGGAAGALTVLDWLLSGGARPTWENPNLIGSALLLSIPWGGWGGWVAALALLATGSRGAWVGALAYALTALQITRERLFAWFIYSFTRLRYSLWWLAASMALAVFVLWPIRPGAVAVRALVWNEAAQLWRARPLAGWGLGAYPALAQVEPLKDHADSLPLTLLAETGLSGFAAMGVLGVVIGAKARRVGGPAAWALLAWGVHQLVDCTLFYPWTVALVAANVALLEVEAP